MTISARNWAWKLHDVTGGGQFVRKILPGEKLVLLCIAEYENAEYGYSFPSQATIATRTCQDERTVRRHIKSLADLGAFKVERRRRRGGAYDHSVYVLNVPAQERITDAEWMRHNE
jgi:hypothetical protein